MRQNKFIEIRDGSSLKTLQLISPLELTNQLKAIKFGSYLQAQGHLVLTPHRAQNCELKLAKITLVQAPEVDYPFQKKNLPLAVILKRL